LGVLALVTAPSALVAQWPGEIRGRITDEVSGRAIPAADLQLLPEAMQAVSIADGSFHFRGLEPGHHVLRVTAFGYATSTVDVEVRNGVVRDLRIALGPVALVIEGVNASVVASSDRAITLGAARIRSTPGNTVADVLRTVPGVLIVATTPGGPQTPTIRGSGADAVLVLVDGVPLNDPITGEADLSTLSTSGVESITVLPGGQSARYGARAVAGAILVRTGSPERGTTVGGGAGSLGERHAEASKTWSSLGGRLDAAGTYRRRDGGFDFELPPEVGGGESRIANADSHVWSGRLAWTQDATEGRATLGLSGEHVGRGLPGRSFAPSPQARQQLTQARVFASGARNMSAVSSGRASGYVHYYRASFLDPAPPFGDPFDDGTTLIGAGGESSFSRSLGRGTLEFGTAAKHVHVESTVLSTLETPTRTDLGAWLSGAYVDGPLGTAWTGAIRLDHSGLPAQWFGSHDVRVQATLGTLTIHAGHKSSFSPPTLGDQFFREGVRVEPNPDLRAERVPSEWVGGAALRAGVRGLVLSLDAEAYLGATKDMIVWLPDYRFVWSPRNLDVNRRGLDVHGRILLPTSGIETWASWSYNRATYDRANSADVQVVYRPRHRSDFGASLTRSAWSILVNSRYTGERFPVPNDVNELAAFWAVDVSARHEWALGTAALDLQLEVERLFDERDELIFAYPHPGRTLRVTLRVGRTSRP
jgi:outer membrane cobalamin receptor